MIGNGPFKLEKPRTDQEIVARPQRQVGRRHLRQQATQARQDHLRDLAGPRLAYNSFEAGEGDTANIPPGRVQGGRRQLRHHARRRRSSARTTSSFNMDDPVVGGAENKLLRQAISQAIDREDDQRRGLRRHPHDLDRHHARRASPASKADLCDYCAYDDGRGPEGVRRLEGGRQLADRADPDPVQRRRRPRARRGRSSSTT